MEKKYLTEVVLLTKSYNLQDFKDWLHWHINIIKFDHCHIFDNESLVDIKSVCDSYGDKVSYEKIIGWPNQYELYNRYINNESRAWWVLPIDDDEFLYVSEKYNNIKTFFLTNEFIKKNNIHKLCVGWRNLFPKEFQETRSKSIIENATAFSDDICQIWQNGNEPVKTFVWTGMKYCWADKDGFHKTHNPFTVGYNENSYTLNNEIIVNSKQINATKGNEDLILYHYQYKSDSEWKLKCKNGSPGNKKFSDKKAKQTHIYASLYKKHVNFDVDNRMLNLWKTING